MSNAYRFGRFELLPQQRRLLEEGRPVALGQRAFDVLMALVEHAGELVSKDALFALVWPGVVVEENNLQVQVSTLRRILGNASIATTAGRGYRFTLEVATAGSSAPRAASRHNLPPQFTRLIGREDELDECAELLAEARLLTLTGIGGCGKTRLALALAERLLPAFPDGVWYVDLAPLLDAERVALTVAATLDIREIGERPIIDTLCDRLAGRHCLLVLDNCEHLVDACGALLQRLLGAGASLRALVGSREALGVPAERAVTVRSLPFPPPGSKLGSRALESSAAVRLFVDRARQSIADFELTDDTVEAVVEICRRLDGIPLAIELAAARVNVLSVEEIRTRLDDRFRLLTGGSRTALGRQQTLLAAMQWSYDHLAPAEQQLLRRVSVFVGGWTLDGAVEVAGDGWDEYTVLDLLSRLVDRSLVVAHRVGRGGTRYSMLETVRQYANERLAEAGEGDAIRKRHLEFYLAFAEAVEQECDGPEEGTWLARLDFELENLLAAHAFCDRASEFAEIGLQLVASMEAYMIERSLLALGSRELSMALSRPGAQREGLARCRAIYAAGKLSYFMGRHGEARERLQRSLSIATALRDEYREAVALRWLGNVESSLGNVAVAGSHFDRALELSHGFQEREGKLFRSKLLNSLANMNFDNGNPDEAARLYREALVLDRELGNHACTAANLGNLAQLSVMQGLEDKAPAMLREAAAIVEQFGLKRLGLGTLATAAELAACFGDALSAARFHGAAESLCAQTGYALEGDTSSLVAAIARTREVLGAEAFTAAESVGRSLSYEEAIADMRAWLHARA